MMWYEHLLGVLAVVTCAGLPPIALVIYALCVIAGEDHVKHIEPR